MESNTNDGGAIASLDDYKEDAKGQYAYWCDELEQSEKRRKKWHKQADRVVARYLDDRREVNTGVTAADLGSDSFQRLNLFHSNIQTLLSMMYGNLPKVDVSRRYADADDDVSRVASEMLERLLNNDIEENGEDYNCVLRACLL
ncbi:MAG: hypothetical protein ACR2PH_01660, partial [Desulfobulbia bacterium]